MDGALTDTTTPSQSRPGSYEVVIPILQSSRTEAPPSDGLRSYPGH